MNKLAMIKAFARLEDRSVELRGDSYYGTEAHGQLYNPFCYTINCRARDTYNVTVKYDVLGDDLVCCIVECGVGLSYVGFETESKEEVPFLVIECILKSEGFYESY